MSRVVLHIGTHKTATTTIQDMFAHNAALLAEHGIIYPKMRPATGHHGLVTDWNHALPSIYRLSAGSMGTLQKLAASYANTDKTVFLSSEEFSRGRPGGRPDFAAIREALSAFDTIEIVCVLREQWQFIQSIFLEVAKSRQPMRPPQLVDTVLVEDMIEGLWTDYNLLYDALLESFAPEEIRFMDFDTCRRAPGGVVGAMLSYLNTGLTADMLTTVNDGRSNTSPQPLPSWAANIICDPHVAPEWCIQSITGAFNVQFGADTRSMIWTRDECQTLQGYAAQCNNRLSERLEPVQPGFAVTATTLMTPENQRKIVCREDANADFWVRCNRWIFAAIRQGTAK